LAAGIAWWSGERDTALARAAIAVLPFDNLGGDESTGRLANGITEDIITDLARFRDFDVIARNSTEIYAGKPVDVRQVGKDLGVRYVLEGSVQRQGEEIRVTAQLIDAKDGAHVWSERWDRPAKDVFAVQTEIVEQAVNRLGGGGVIMEAENRAALRKRPENLGAYELYLLGRDRILNPTKERVDEAIDLFKRAVELDPTLARAWVDLAWAHDQSAGYGADGATAHKAALEAARRAVELDPMDAGAHTVLGTMLGFEGKTDVAKIEFEEALRLNPGSADILTQYAGWASSFGDPQAGAEAADRALKMNPNIPNSMVGWLSYGYLMAERFEDSLRMEQRLSDESRDMYSWAKLAMSLSQVGRKEEAKTAVEQALKRHPDLTAEGFANEPGATDTERRKLLEWMQSAGFPPCAKPGQLDGVEKPRRISECTS
jgi:TolB-like protein/Flp pilus assembly protein TadD